MTYQERSMVLGIPTMRFTMPPELFAGPNRNPENKCFCQTPEDTRKCDGIFDLGPCLFGAPMALSFAHFLHANSYIRDKVEGLDPDPEKHATRIDVEPVAFFITKMSFN